MYWPKVVVTISLAAIGSCLSKDLPSPESAYRRSVLGRRIPRQQSDNRRFADQMYVEHLMPASGPVTKPYLLVFLHGTGGTGAVGSHILSW